MKTINEEFFGRFADGKSGEHRSYAYGLALECQVLRIRIRDLVPSGPLDPGSEMGKKIMIRIWDPDRG